MPKISSMTLAALFVAACISTSAAFAGNSMVCTDATNGEKYSARQDGGKIKLKGPNWSANLTVIASYRILNSYTTKVNKNGIWTNVTFDGPSSPLLIEYFKQGPYKGKVRPYRQDRCRHGGQLVQTYPKPQGNSVLDGIKQKCFSEWPGDYRMQKYCIDKQIEAYNALLSY